MIDMNKKYTFNGKAGKILTTDASEPYSVIWMDIQGETITFTSNGFQYDDDASIKLIEVKPTRWINVYPPCVCGPYDSREVADGYAGGNRIACIEFKEGDGLE